MVANKIPKMIGTGRRKRGGEHQGEDLRLVADLGEANDDG
jgi:hypothetical protein